MTPAPAERASSLRPRTEGPIGAPTPNELPTSEPTQSEELALMQRREPSAPPGFSLSWADKSNPPPEDAALLVGIPLGAQVHLSSLETVGDSLS